MIKLQNVKKSFLKKEILKDIHMNIANGDFVLIYGKSGSGKSTLLHLLGGLESVDSGCLSIHDQPLNKMSFKAKRRLRQKEVGFIFQNYALVSNETVLENLQLVTKNKEDIIKSLKQVRLTEDLLKRKIFELSGGEQQRVAIARVLLQEVRIILADEPTGNLDGENAEMIFILLKELQQQGKTILCVSHDEKAAKYANRFFSLQNGHLKENNPLNLN